MVQHRDLLQHSEPVTKAWLELQEVLLMVGVLGHVVPLLFGYDATHDAGSQPDHFDYTGTHKAQGPAFLGLGIQRSNMQVLSLNFTERPHCQRCTRDDCLGTRPNCLGTGNDWNGQLMWTLALLHKAGHCST